MIYCIIENINLIYNINVLNHRWYKKESTKRNVEKNLTSVPLEDRIF